LKISDEKVFSHEEGEIDIIVALDQNTINLHQKKLKENGIIIGKKGLKGKNLVEIDTRKILEEERAKQIGENSILFGALLKYLNFDFEKIKGILKEVFGKLWENNEKLIERGYHEMNLNSNFNFEIKNEKRIFISGTEAFGLGAIFSGIDIYFAYPMTPSTPLLHFLSERQLKYNFLVKQLENEIAVANAALGASYAGAKVMIGTSGGGFALMSEAMSLQGVSEVPLVVYLAQRVGPAVGVPTYTAQEDLKFVLNIGHSEFPRVVIAPGDPKEAFEKTVEAFYLAYKYRVLAILLSDKHLSESNFTFENFEEPKIERSRFLIEPKEDYKNYLITEDGISPRTYPGSKAIVKATSYEHDEFGITTEDPEWIKKMKEKRIRKFESLEKEVKERFEMVKVYGNGKNLIISWGSTKGAILDFLKKNNQFKFLQILYIEPFPKDIVKKEIENSEKVFVVENNSTSLLSQVIKEKIGIEIENKILKYDGRPFTPKEIEVRLNEN
ncbi:MAG: hypothetical protein B6U78_01935, partial [Candidatus Aenigmarchaeota archaeon ex4484_224]